MSAIVDPAFIASVRKKLALDQREAAQIFGGGVNAFSRYENGKTKPPLALVKLLKVLDRHPDLLAEVRAARSGCSAQSRGPQRAQLLAEVGISLLRCGFEPQPTPAFSFPKNLSKFAGCPRCLAFGHLGEHLQPQPTPAFSFPQKPQQNRVSSPSAPQKSP